METRDFTFLIRRRTLALIKIQELCHFCHELYWPLQSSFKHIYSLQGNHFNLDHWLPFYLYVQRGTLQKQKCAVYHNQTIAEVSESIDEPLEQQITLHPSLNGNFQNTRQVSAVFQKIRIDKISNIKIGSKFSENISIWSFPLRDPRFQPSPLSERKRCHLF